jgi:hypothetical protein
MFYPLSFFTHPLIFPEGVPEVKRMETSREVIFDSVRQGFAAAYNALVVDDANKV